VELTLIVTCVKKRAEESLGEVLWIHKYNVRGVWAQADEEKGAITHTV